MTLDEVAAEIEDVFRTVHHSERRGAVLAVVAKREAWVYDAFQALRRADAAREGRDVMRLEALLGVRGTAPAGPLVPRGRSAGG